MKQLLALITVLLVATPAYCADREEARVRVREAAYQAIQRHQVTERYRYYVPVSAFAQRRGDDPRMHTKHLSQEEEQARSERLVPATSLNGRVKVSIDPGGE